MSETTIAVAYAAIADIYQRLETAEQNAEHLQGEVDSLTSQLFQIQEGKP